jgi:hypothetical protein
MTRRFRVFVRYGMVLGALSVGGAARLKAQLLGLNLIGDVGLQSGSQPPPGLYVLVPSYYRADYAGVRNADGNTVARGARLSMSFIAAPAMAVVTRMTVLNATYGLQFVVPFSNTRLAIAEPSLSASQSYEFTDMYVQPANLGWHTRRADFLAAYAFFMPTGTTNHSLDMWAHELSAGSTLYFDDRHKWHLAGTAFYEMHQRKNDADLKVGDLLTIEGGLGTSFLEANAARAGLAYAAQWKITNDGGSDFPPNLPKSRSRVFALGPEVSMPVFAVGALAGLLNARYEWEFGGRSTFEGHVWTVGFTLAQLTLK